MRKMRTSALEGSAGLESAVSANRRSVLWFGRILRLLFVGLDQVSSVFAIFCWRALAPFCMGTMDVPTPD